MIWVYRKQEYKYFIGELLCNGTNIIFITQQRKIITKKLNFRNQRAENEKQLHSEMKRKRIAKIFFFCISKGSMQ